MGLRYHPLHHVHCQTEWPGHRYLLEQTPRVCLGPEPSCFESAPPISVSLLTASAPWLAVQGSLSLSAELLLYACLCIFFDCVKSLCVRNLPTQGELGEQGQGLLPQLDR